mmetsp:Transcript_60126/g.105276  ORF Transcript_60126/g.105276 Transcript_60126/m.105276 type:complete len:251 (+) Transcript_60126:620-1372(+)
MTATSAMTATGGMTAIGVTIATGVMIARGAMIATGAMTVTLGAIEIGAPAIMMTAMIVTVIWTETEGASGMTGTATVAAIEIAMQAASAPLGMILIRATTAIAGMRTTTPMMEIGAKSDESVGRKRLAMRSAVTVATAAAAAEEESRKMTISAQISRAVNQHQRLLLAIMEEACLILTHHPRQRIRSRPAVNGQLSQVFPLLQPRLQLLLRRQRSLQVHQHQRHQVLAFLTSILGRPRQLLLQHLLIRWA